MPKSNNVNHVVELFKGKSLLHPPPFRKYSILYVHYVETTDLKSNTIGFSIL
jgi:hypothetical protein